MRVWVAMQAASLVDLAPPTIADVRVCARSVNGVKADVRLCVRVVGRRTVPTALLPLTVTRPDTTQP